MAEDPDRDITDDAEVMVEADEGVGADEWGHHAVEQAAVMVEEGAQLGHENAGVDAAEQEGGAGQEDVAEQEDGAGQEENAAEQEDVAVEDQPDELTEAERLVMTQLRQDFRNRIVRIVFKSINREAKFLE